MRILERRVARFLREPPSVRGAIGVIVAATALVVVSGGALVTLFDREEFPNIWLGMWFALQTVTTVGYGDVTPTQLGGRLVAAIVMLQGIALVAIITAAVTSTFVARAAREQAAALGDAELTDRQLMEQRFADLERKLDLLASGREERGA
jgi:voltage-gated potassium channel